MLHHIVKLITMSTKNAEEEEDRNHPVPLFIEATTTTSALEKLSKINFKSAEFTNQKIILIKIKIDEKIDEKLNETSFALYFNASSAVLLTIKSEKLAKIFWKTANSEKFYLLQICDVFGDIELDFCEQFLISEIIDDKNGILSKSQERRNLNLQDIGNENEQNLLMLASIDNRDDVVAELLKHDFDVDDEDSEEHNAIEKAWMNCTNASNLEIKEKSCKIILSLLKNNSKYPKKFDFKMKNELEVKSYEFSYENCSESVKNFVDYSEKLHSLVTESNLEELKLEIVKEPRLCYFYDRNNKSLIAHAIETKDIDAWKFLISLKLSIGQHEIQNLGDFYKNYELSKKRLMRTEHQKCARDLPSSHIHFLLTCSRIGSNDRRSDERWNLIEEAFRIMDTDKSCSKILKIATKWKRLTIYFDFKHDTAYYLDPVSSLGTKGVIYGVHMIYIGAKYLPDVKMKHEVIGTIIHELCHLAVFLTYINNYDPYPKGESDDKRRFEDEVVPECEENGDFEDIVGTVAYYIQEHHNSEYIVRIVQMLMHYYVLDPTIECENSKILQDRREKFGKLFKYFEEVVERDFNDFLEIIDTLLDESVDIKYDQLTGPMKARILHSKVNFQGQETTLHEIIGNKEEILSKMTSKQIRDMLIKGDCIEIGSQHKTTTKFSSVERQFKIPSSYKCKTMSDIQSEVEDTKIFILSDSAGAGKTTTFEELTANLKETNKNSWVSFAKLRTYRSIFDSYNKSKDLCLEDVLALLIDIKDLKDKLEVDIFKFLFANDRVILLLDGVDEISPDYNNFMIKIMKILKEKTINQLWISSRPQCANMLEESLNVQAHKLEPYTVEERDTFINEIYDSYKECSKDISKADTMNDLKVFFELLKNDQYNNEVNNPLMIKMITELYIQGQIDLDTESANLFDIFDKVTGKLRKEVGQKVESEDNDAFKVFNLGHVHQLLALKVLFKYKDVKDLSIMERWKEERKNWTVDRIQRFGFVTLDARFDKDPRRSYIDFIHRTYADFFAAQFIISITFDSNCEELQRNKDFKILLLLINELQKDSSILKFILSFLQSNKNKKIHGNKNIEWFCELIDVSIKHKSLKIDNHEFKVNFSFVEFFFTILSNNPKIIVSIWNLMESQNLLEFLLFQKIFLFDEINEILQISFGQNWDEKFKRNENLGKIELSSEFCKLKLFEFVESNYNITKREAIYDHSQMYYYVDAMPESVRQNLKVKIFNRFVEISCDEEQECFLTIMKNFIYDRKDIENLLFFQHNCENLLKSCSKKDKDFLNKFQTYIVELIFVDQMRFQDLKIFKSFQQFKFTWKNDEMFKIKLQAWLKWRKVQLSLFDTYSDEDLRDFKDFLLIIFENNKSEIFGIFEFNDNFSSNSSQKSYDLIANDKKFKRFDSFLSDFNNS
ncbi:hypothetical protein ACKWTF_015903 [Chironomus riparius]